MYPKKKDKVQANHNQLDESHRKEDLQKRKSFTQI